MNENLISILERADNEDLKTLCDIITLGKNRTPRIGDSLTRTSGTQPVWRQLCSQLLQRGRVGLFFDSAKSSKATESQFS